MAQITNREMLVQALIDQCVVTWSFHDTMNILGVDTDSKKVYQWLDPGYARMYRQNFDDKLPDDFFVNTSTDVWQRSKHEDTELLTITNENFWLWRESLRAFNGEYKIPDFMKVLRHRGLIKHGFNLHAVHESTDDPTMVAYTPSHEYGKRDRQVRVKVGKYLQKYYADVLTASEIRDMANTAKPFGLQWATTQDEMRHVYENGPGSCMSGKCWDHLKGHHPVDVYVGEFKLAYIARAAGFIVARCLVHEPSKRYVRTYGDEADTLAALLDQAGYSRDSDWEGARVKRIHLRDDRYVMPYVDGGARTIYPDPGNVNYFILTSDDDDKDETAYCDSTNGYVDLDSGGRYTCDCCGSRVRNEDDISYSEYNDVSFGPCCSDEFRWAYTGPCCSDEFRRAYTGRRGQMDWVRTDDAIYCESDREYYAESFANEAGVVCTERGDWWKLEECVVDMDGNYVHQDDAIEEGKDEYGDMQYVHDTDFVPKLIVKFDETKQRVIQAIYHPDYMPEDEQEAMDGQEYIVTDYGVRVGKQYESLGQLLLAYGEDYMYQNRRGFWFYWSNTRLYFAHAEMTRLPLAA